MNDIPAAEPAAQAEITDQVRTLEFTGSAREYFRIWIVNLFLSAVTLGLYSPWAKVRKKRYLYGNTWLAGANFEYHGNPVAILKGRLIAVAALIAYNVAGHYIPKLGTAVLLVLMIAAPWLIVRSFQFNAENSTYRNVRFHFHGRYAEGLRAIAPLLLTPILVLLLPTVDPAHIPSGSEIWMLFVPSLPILLFYPYVMGAIKRMHVGNSAFGAAPFSFSARIRSFYGIYFLAMLVFVGWMMLVGMVVAATIAIPGAAWVTGPLGYLFAISLFFGYTRARVVNITFNHAAIGEGLWFVSTLKAMKLGWIYFGNLVAIVVSCGLLVPWAVVRTTRYRASSLRVECPQGLEAFLATVVALEGRAVGATGEQMGEFFDVDLSL